MVLTICDKDLKEKQEKATLQAGILRMALPLHDNILFDYLPCPDLDINHLRPGVRYLVPCGHRKMVGILVETRSSSDYPENKLKAVICPLDSEPVIDKKLFTLCGQAAAYYHASLGETLYMALPIRLRRAKVIKKPVFKYWSLTAGNDHKNNISPKAYKQKKTIELLEQAGGKLSDNALRLQGISTATIKSLQTQSIIYSQEAPVFHKDFRNTPVLSPTNSLTLNSEQKNALDLITKTLSEFSSILLHGITGSGKTEVYLQAIAEVLKTGKQALVMVPEIGLTPQMIARFRNRFNTPVAIMHSGMTDLERYDQWQKARKKEAGIIISTRSGVFSSLPLLGLIVVDEEHDTSYKQQEGIRYSARDIAILRAKLENIPVILGSATPSLESLLKAKQGQYHYLSLSRRAGRAIPPEFFLADMRKTELNAGLTAPVIEAIRTTLESRQQVLVFINRRGFSPSLVCGNCGTVIDCAFCDAYLTLHRFPPHLHCHHCGHERKIPVHCERCKSTELVATGTGTERTEMALQELFPDTTILRVDRDSTRKKNSLNDMLSTIKNDQPAIIVGTQMLAKGHHFPLVTLAVIINADNGFFSADFRGEEKTAQLLLQVAGRSGREALPGHVLIQTYNPDNPDLLLLIEEGYMAFATRQLQLRKSCHLPPYAHLALFTLENTNANMAESSLYTIARIAKKIAHQIKELKIIGPMPAPLEKKQGRFRWQLLFQAKKRSVLHYFLDNFLPTIKTVKNIRKSRWLIDIDPQEMF